LFSGAEGIKTLDQRIKFGGVENMPYDHCYHLSCDTILNINFMGLSELSEAAAHATYYFSMANFKLIFQNIVRN
jgi:aminopeptidase S